VSVIGITQEDTNKLSRKLQILTPKRHHRYIPLGIYRRLRW